jgi:RNA polymerase sigma-70 factor (ECF subfamily)
LNQRGDLILTTADEAGPDAVEMTESSRWISSARLVTQDRLPALLDEFRPYLRNIAAMELPVQLSARLDASDVVQETLLRAFRQFHQFTGQTDIEFLGWLRSILINQIIDAVRHHGRRTRDASRDYPVSSDLVCQKTQVAGDVTIQAEASQQLHKAMELLPEDYQEVLKLRQVENLTFEEIGERMGRSADAARMLWGRAVMQLGKKMSDLE